MEVSDDFPLPIHLQSNFQNFYNRDLYGTWSSFIPVPDVGTTIFFFGSSYMIVKSKINVENLRFLILSHVFVPPKKSLSLMSFCGCLYSRFDYFNIVKYKHIISMYSMCMSVYASGNFNKKNLLYIDDSPRTHGNIAGFINIYRTSLFSINKMILITWLQKIWEWILVIVEFT